jgi:hypothetical protein
MMPDKIQKNSHPEDATQDLRDLDSAVIQRLQCDSKFEDKMIANFNAKVNSIHHPSSEKQIIKQNKGESGGPSGLEPTRYGDWERKGRCSDF